jgi:hypothetical protein
MADYDFEMRNTTIQQACLCYISENRVLPERDLNQEQLSYLQQKFVDLLDVAYENPKVSFTASFVYIGGMTAAVVFFCRYISHQGF